MTLWPLCGAAPRTAPWILGPGPQGDHGGRGASLSQAPREGDPRAHLSPRLAPYGAGPRCCTYETIQVSVLRILVASTGRVHPIFDVARAAAAETETLRI